MRMTEAQWRGERLYTAVMLPLLRQLRQGRLDRERYERINAQMREQYRPISDGLLLETREVTPCRAGSDG